MSVVMQNDRLILKFLGLYLCLPVLASSRQCLCRGALQHWFALTEHESLAAGAHNLRQYVCVCELKFPDTGKGDLN